MKYVGFFIGLAIAIGSIGMICPASPI